MRFEVVAPNTLPASQVQALLGSQVSPSPAHGTESHLHLCQIYLISLMHTENSIAVMGVMAPCSPNQSWFFPHSQPHSEATSRRCQMPPGQAPDEAEGPREMCLKSGLAIVAMAPLKEAPVCGRVQKPVGRPIEPSLRTQMDHLSFFIGRFDLIVDS